MSPGTPGTCETATSAVPKNRCILTDAFHSQNVETRGGTEKQSAVTSSQREQHVNSINESHFSSALPKKKKKRPFHCLVVQRWSRSTLVQN